jgi:endonuclease/exonuclease/phosphatase family metal-dependent hydrolase
MTASFKSIITQSIHIVAAINLVVYLLACATPYIQPATFFAFTFLALGFPLLLISILCWIVFYLFANRSKAILFTLLLFLGYKNISTTFAFYFKQQNLAQKDSNSFRVLSWNIRGFVSRENNKDIIAGCLNGVMNYIKLTNADVVCLQDFEITLVPNHTTPLTYLQDSLGYKNVYFSIDIDKPVKEGRSKYGTCIFSKYPIIQAHSIQYYGGKHFCESLGYADIKIKNNTVRIFNTHLKSMYIGILPSAKITDFNYIIDDTNLVFHSTKFEKLQRFDTAHLNQATIIKKVMDTTKMPFVFCGDLNSVPSSYVYHQISHNLNDAFLQKGLGWGGTYCSNLPFLRIDVILMNKALKTIQYFSPKLNLSDHYPVVADLQFNN